MHMVSIFCSNELIDYNAIIFYCWCAEAVYYVYASPAAKLLRELAEDFIDAFIDIAGPEKGTVYMHWMLCHVEKAVREYGSLLKFSCQGLEAIHGLLKYVTHQHANRSAKHTCGTSLTRINLMLTNTTVTNNSRGLVHGAACKDEAVVVNAAHLSKAQLELKRERGEKMDAALAEWVQCKKQRCCEGQ